MFRPIFHVSVLFGLLSICTEASGATCDLNEQVLPEKDLVTKFGARDITLRVSAALRFTHDEGEIYAISETTRVQFDNAHEVIKGLIEDEVGNLPTDQCGTAAVLGAGETNVRNGALIVSLPVEIEQRECLLNVSGLIAKGTLNFTITFVPKMDKNKLLLESDVEVSEDVMTTIPDVDPELSSTLQQGINDAVKDAASSVETSISKIKAKLEEVQANVEDPTAPIKPIYQPKQLSIMFYKQGDSIGLVNSREAKAREGTSCTIRKMVTQKWKELN